MGEKDFENLELNGRDYFINKAIDSLYTTSPLLSSEDREQYTKIVMNKLMQQINNVCDSLSSIEEKEKYLNSVRSFFELVQNNSKKVSSKLVCEVAELQTVNDMKKIFYC